MKHHNSMSLDEVRDELARLVYPGHHYVHGSTSGNLIRRYRSAPTNTEYVPTDLVTHPIPATLDAAAAALPIGWEVSTVVYPDGKTEVSAWRNAATAEQVITVPKIGRAHV